MCLARHGDGDVVMLNLNHAAADAAGALRVLERIARAYAGDAEPAAPLQFLASRDLPVRPAAPSSSLLSRAHARVVERLRDALSRPVGLTPEQPADEPGYGFHLVTLSAADTARVLDARAPGDLLMTAMHLAIGDWNRTHGTRGGRVGVLVPADLRPEDWQPDTIGNFSVTSRVSTRRRERAKPASALKAVAAQAARNKRTRTGIALIAGLQRAGMLAFWAKQSVVVITPLKTNSHVDAAILCSGGSVPDAPHFGSDAGETKQLWFSTPARSPSSLCLGYVTAGGRLHLTFRYPHRLFDADAARRFAAGFVEQLRLAADC
jgi:NRPS condensation-like uncharacterized protein